MLAAYSLHKHQKKNRNKNKNKKGRRKIEKIKIREKLIKLENSKWIDYQ
jgi:hypothetical protein